MLYGLAASREKTQLGDFPLNFAHGSSKAETAFSQPTRPLSKQCLPHRGPRKEAF